MHDLERKRKTYYETVVQNKIVPLGIMLLFRDPTCSELDPSKILLSMELADIISLPMHVTCWPVTWIPPSSPATEYS
jgi:hypothetical protein